MTAPRWPVCLAVLGSVTLGCPADIIISEAMSENRHALADEDGDFPDWIELQNLGVEPVNLNGFGLSDNPDFPFKWTFPGVEIGPGEFLLVFASGKNRKQQYQPLPIQTDDKNFPKTLPGLFLWLDGTDTGSLELDDSGRIVKWRDKSDVLTNAVGVKSLNPASVEGLALWLDASAPDAFDFQGSLIAKWKDRSHKGNHATQDTTSRRPILKTRGAGMLPLVNFDGVDDYLTFPRISKIRTVFWVLRENDDASDNYRPLLGDAKHFDFARAKHKALYSGDSKTWAFLGKTWIDGMKAPVRMTRPPADSLGLVTTVTAGLARANNLASDRLLPKRVWDGDMGEIVIFIRELQKQERLGIELYLREKWSIPSRISATRDAFQPRMERRPRPGRDSLSGMQMVAFDGVDDYLQFPETDEVKTIFWVGREDPHASDSHRPLLGDSVAPHLVRGNDKLMFLQEGRIGSAGTSVWLEDGLVNPKTTRLPPRLTFVAIASGASLQVSTVSSDRLLPDSVWSGDIGELLLFDRVLGGEGFSAISNWLRQKWALPQKTLHANFQLGNDGEMLLLTAPGGDRLSVLEVPGLEAGVSFGRKTEGGAGFFEQPTPGAENTTAFFSGVSSKPIFSVDGAFFAGPFMLEIAAGNPEERVLFTTDGSVPMPDATVYQMPLTLEQTTVIRARCVREGRLPGPVVTRTFFVGEQNVGFPIISLVVDPAHFFDKRSGIYTQGEEPGEVVGPLTPNFERDWERPVNLAFFESAGWLAFQQDSGIKIHGGWTRRYPQKSLRLYARNRYGKDFFSHRIFSDLPVDRFKRLILRNAGNDWRTAFMRDGVAHALMSEMGLDTQAWRPVLVFLNGRYWGIHNLRERNDSHNLALRLGIPADEIDLIQGYSEIRAGDFESFNQFLQFMRAADPDDEDYFHEVGGFMDIDNFIDYMAAEIILGNTDWPSNNVRFWRSRMDDGRWRWIPFDFDAALGAVDKTGAHNTLAIGISKIPGQVPPWPAYLLRELLGNSRYRARFAGRFAMWLNTIFQPEQVIAKIDVAEAELFSGVERHATRWGGARATYTTFYNVAQWKEHVEVLRTFARNRPKHVWQHLARKFDTGTATLRIVQQDPHRGTIRIGGIPVPNRDATGEGEPWEGRFLTGLPLEIIATPNTGYRLAGWDGLPGKATSQSVPLDGPLFLRPRFVPDREFAAEELQPMPHDLALGPYSLIALDPQQPAGTYPPAVRLRQTQVKDPGLRTEMDSDWTLPYERTSRSRIQGLGDDGFLFVNTGKTQADGGGFSGAAVLSLGTLGMEKVNVTWTAGTIASHDRPSAVRLQFRVGASGNFQDVTDIAENLVEYPSRLEAGHKQTLGPVMLPVSAADRPLIQLRWKYYQTVAHGTGSRAGIRVDDIQVEAKPIQRLVITAISKKEPGKVAIVFQGLSGHSHQLEQSVDLKNWRHLRPTGLDAGGRGRVNVGTESEPGVRFFRIRALAQ